jgi:ribosomal protein S18 acetylase RimI-like enzyme
MPEFRGQQIAQKLINHLKSLSKINNWNGIRWITHSSNENAKKLYVKIANNTGFELYELKRD